MIASQLYIVVTVSNLLAFSCGIVFAWSSPVLVKINGDKESNSNPLGSPVSADEESWIVAIMSLGCVFGPLFGGIFADKIGRKPTLIIVGLPLAISSLVLSFSGSVVLFCAARFLAGLGVGGAITVLPIYLSEIAEDHNRGTVSCLMGVNIASGLLFAYAVGPYLTVRTFCWVCTLPPLVFIATFALIGPETPIFLATVDNVEAIKSLRKLRHKTLVEIEDEMFNISAQAQNKTGLVKLFQSKAIAKALFISLSLVVLQQLCGITAVLSYLETIFGATGNKLSPEISSIVIGAIQVFTVVLTSLFVDRWGRKVLLQISSIGSGLSLLTLGVFFYLQKNEFDVDGVAWLPIFSLIVYIICFNLGLGPLPLTVMAELFPSDVKSICSTLTITLCFLAAFIIALFFPTFSLVVGLAQLFWTFAFACLIATVFIYRVLPETKGKTIQEIQSLL